MTTKQSKAQERAEAIANLRSMLPPGSTVYTILRHVARSGMTRRISLSAIIDGHPHDLDGRVARACGWTWDRDKGGIRASGCGMDMGFHLVSTLSRVLYPEGFGCIGDKCLSNDHSNGDRDYTPHVDDVARCAACGDAWPCGVRREPDIYTPVAQRAHKLADSKAHWHRAGDYALRHRWI